MDDALISVSDARQRVFESVRLLPAEKVAIEDALDRVLAEDVLAGGDVPPFPCSAMDGYAVKAGPGGRRLRIAGQSRAGLPVDHMLEDDEAIRISTGAALPRGATAVIRQEDTEIPDERTVLLRTAVSEGENIRLAGEDQHAGATVLSAGMTLGAAGLAAAVAAGRAGVSVSRRPRVAILCTGDELRAPGEPLGPGQIHNSNAPMLTALAAQAGAETTPAVLLPDDRERTKQGLAAALAQSDVVIVSGGVSVGPHDHVKPALKSLDVDERFWGIALKPGKPTWFGARGDQIVFGLPGNPVSAAVTFTLFAHPALRAMQGDTEVPRRPMEAELGTPVRSSQTREQAVRVRLQHRDGRAIATPTGPQGSHLVSSLLGADGLAMIPSGVGELNVGERVQVELLPR